MIINHHQIVKNPRKYENKMWQRKKCVYTLKKELLQNFCISWLLKFILHMLTQLYYITLHELQLYTFCYMTVIISIVYSHLPDTFFNSLSICEASIDLQNSHYCNSINRLKKMFLFHTFLNICSPLLYKLMFCCSN